jgi:hypothetical protein
MHQVRIGELAINKIVVEMDDLTTNIICQNNNSKNHGRDNTVFVNSTQPR